VREISREEYDRLKRFENITDNGVVFMDEPSGSEGYWFCLIRESHHTDEDIECAKREIRHKRDATSIEVGVLAPSIQELFQTLQTEISEHIGTAPVSGEVMNEVYEILKGLTIEQLEQMRDVTCFTHFTGDELTLFIHQCNFTIERKQAGVW
jgi:hypothetical protein